MANSPSANIAVRYRISLFLALIAAGLAGNHFRFSILNAAFIFGSIFAMLALQFFGLARGIVAAAIISSYTYFAWNHPYAVMTMTAEAAVVGWLISRRKMNLVIADALYWLFIGIPIGYLGFHVISNFPISNTLFLMTKQAINGIANALMARLIFAGYLFRLNTALISFREVVSSMLAFFVLCPALIMLIVGSKADLAETDHHIRTMLSQDSRQVTDSLENWVADRKEPIIRLAGMAKTLSPVQMQRSLEQAQISDANFLRIGLMDKEAIATAYSPPVDEQGRNTIGKSFADRPYIPVLKQKRKLMLSEVIVSRFGRPDPIAIILAPVLSGGDYRGYVAGILNFKRLHGILELNSAERAILYTLLDRNGNVIITNRTGQKVMTPFTRGEGTLSPSENGILRWIPALPPNTSTIELWGKSLYISESQIGDLADWKLILEQPVAPFQKKLYDNYTGKFFMLFMVLLGSLALAEFVSRRIAKTTEQLSYITHDLPLKLISGTQIDWPPKSGILETDRLLRHFREMADSLRAKFVEKRQMNESLEQRVEERTEELRKSEGRFRGLFEQAAVGVAEIVMETGRFIIVNRRFCEIVGRTEEELLATTFLAITHPKDLHLHKEKTRMLLSGEIGHYSLEKRYLRKNEEIVWVNITVSPLWKPGERPGRNMVVAEDITQRKRTEQEMGILADIGRAVGSTLDFEQVFERVATEVRKLIPYDRLLVNLMKPGNNEFVVAYACGVLNPGRRLWDSYPCKGTTTGVVVTTRAGLLVQPEDAEEIKDLYPNLYSTFKTGLPSTMSVPLISMDEVIGCLTFRSKKRKAYTEQDLRLTEKIGMQIAGAIANAQLFKDLSETEKSLRESEEKYRELVEFLPISVFETDNSMRITSFNQTALETFRYAAEDPIIGMDGRQFFMPGEWERLEKDVQEVMDGASKSSLECKIIRKDGSTFTGLVSAGPVIRQGMAAGIRGAVIDITDRIKAMEELQKARDYLLQSEKLAAIGRLAAGVMHEILNPMNIISMELQILMKGSELSPEARQRLTVCMEQIQRIVTIAEDLKGFSSIKENRLAMSGIAAAVDHVLTLYRPQLRLNGIQTDVQCPDDLPMTLMDRERIEQVILNLVENASAAMEEKEEKVLRIAIGLGAVGKMKDCLRVTIADTGTGIRKQNMTKLFEPFFTTKAPGKGTGLGLSISFGIIKDHGGRIWAENNEWGGASFFFEIPITADEEGIVLQQRR